MQILNTYNTSPTLGSIVIYTGSTVEEIADRRKKLSRSLSNALACLEKPYAENQHKKYKYNTMSRLCFYMDQPHGEKRQLQKASSKPLLTGVLEISLAFAGHKNFGIGPINNP